MNYAGFGVLLLKLVVPYFTLFSGIIATELSNFPSNYGST